MKRFAVKYITDIAGEKEMTCVVLFRTYKEIQGEHVRFM
jgi:hypothetical protein